MYSNSEYSSLLAQLNRANAEIMNLKDQVRYYREHKEEREAEIKRDNGFIRSFCEKVLSKDSDEMVTGREYSWSSLSIDMLIEKAEHSYDKHNRERTKLLMKLVDLNDDKDCKIKSLMEQLEQFEHMYGNRGDEEEESESDQVAPQTADEVKAACEEIRIDSVDMTNDMIDSVVDAIKINESVNITAPPVPISEPREKIERIKKEKKKIKESSKIAVLDITESINKVNSIMKEIIIVIGETGMSVYNEILDEVLNRIGDTLSSGFKDKQVRRHFKFLEDQHLIHKDSITTPLKGIVCLARLTAIGGMIYKEFTGKTAVTAEKDLVIQEHDNLEHGYGIKEFAEILENCGKYKNVCWMNGRKKIELKNGSSVIPDIIAEKEKHTEYFEYERATHSFPDMRVKLNKLSSLTQYINIVAPQIAQVKTLLEVVQKWAEESEIPRKCFVRLSTVKYYSDSPGTYKAWMYEYDAENKVLKSLIPQKDAPKEVIE